MEDKMLFFDWLENEWEGEGDSFVINVDDPGTKVTQLIYDGHKKLIRRRVFAADIGDSSTIGIYKEGLDIESVKEFFLEDDYEVLEVDKYHLSLDEITGAELWY